MARFPSRSNSTCFWQFSAAFALIPLAGCASSNSPPPAVQIRTVAVDRPVAIACVKIADLPAEPEKVAGKLTGDARRDLDIVSASALRLRAWGSVMKAMLTGCAK